jgi:hypothetical protein
MKYIIRTESTENDVYYILEEESKPLFGFKGEDLFHTYALFGDIEIVKGKMYDLDQCIFAPKTAIDYFVEETFKKFMDKLHERRQSLFGTNPNSITILQRGTEALPTTL